jgi:hypothetical protein
MNGKIKVLLFVALSGLLLGVSPGPRLSEADDGPARHIAPDEIESASIQFILVSVERDALEELVDESNVLTLDSISIETIGQCIHEERGEIVSQSKLTVLSGHEAEITVIENERRKEKKADEGNSEQGRREAEVFVHIELESHDGDKLAARFTYKRSVIEEGFAEGDKAEEEEGVEQKFEISSGIVLHAEQARVAGANMNEGIATFLIIKADLK